jgi:hypothetical protein
VSRIPSRGPSIRWRLRNSIGRRAVSPPRAGCGSCNADGTASALQLRALIEREGKRQAVGHRGRARNPDRYAASARFAPHRLTRPNYPRFVREAGDGGRGRAVSAARADDAGLAGRLAMRLTARTYRSTLGSMKAEPRSGKLTVRIATLELEMLAALAESTQQTSSEYIRYAIRRLYDEAFPNGPPRRPTGKAPTRKAPTRKAPTRKAPTRKAPTRKAPTRKGR